MENAVILSLLTTTAELSINFAPFGENGGLQNRPPFSRELIAVHINQLQFSLQEVYPCPVSMVPVLGSTESLSYRYLPALMAQGWTAHYSYLSNCRCRQQVRGTIRQLPHLPETFS
jgi:hypothetical protein